LIIILVLVSVIVIWPNAINEQSKNSNKINGFIFEYFMINKVVLL